MATIKEMEKMKAENLSVGCLCNILIARAHKTNGFEFVDAVTKCRLIHILNLSIMDEHLPKSMKG